MAYDVSRHRAVVLVFKLEGCGHCEIYVPRLLERIRVLQAAGVEVELLSEGKPPRKEGVLVAVYDLTNPNAEVNALADRFAVNGMPTTVVLPRGQGALKVEGALTPSQIDALLTNAAR